MNIAELPDQRIIAKFARPAAAGHTLAPIIVNGIPLSTQGEFRSVWVDITPAMATDWLQNNFGNRPVSDHVVYSYARDMVNQTWRATHQGIAFNDGGRLIDGQHRLKAIVLANVTVRMMVTFGLQSAIAGSEATTMDYVDRGRTRSVGDQLKIQHGMKAGSVIAALTTTLANLCCDTRTRRLGVGETLSIYRAFEESLDFVIEHRVKRAGLKSAGVLGAFAFAIQQADKSDGEKTWESPIAKLFTGLMTGTVAGSRQPLGHLHAFLTSEANALIAQGMAHGLAELTLECLRRQLLNEEIADLPPKSEWETGLSVFRAYNMERTGKIAALFKLAIQRPEPARGKTVIIDNAIGQGKFPVQERTTVTTAVPEPAAVPKSPPEVRARPTVAEILQAVENQTKLSKLIIAGKGNDADLSLARFLTVNLANSYGHTLDEIGLALRRSATIVKDMIAPPSAWTGKQRIAYGVLKARFNKGAK